MQTKTELARILEQGGQEPAFDASVKRILSNKHMLAWIMKGCVAEYEHCSINEIIENYIEGEPQVASTPVHRDDAAGDMIYGLDTVDKTSGEHNTLYDILFYATLPGSEEKIGLFINVEAQNQFRPKYPLVKRGIYYCSRLISAQFGRDFADGEYGKLKKVYSIWICANVPDSRDNTITSYSLSENQLLGSASELRKNYDMMSVIMVCFNDKHIEESMSDGRIGDDCADMVRLLRLVLSGKTDQSEKKQILSDEYDIPMTRELEERVLNMCNLSQGIKEMGIEEGRLEGRLEGRAEGREEGREEGRAEGLEMGELQRAMKTALKMLKKNMSVTDILEFTELTLEQLKDVAKTNGLELAAE